MIDENTVIDAVDSILESITTEDSQPLFQERHLVVPSQYEKYPATYISPVSWDEQLADLRDTQVDAVFRIGIVYALDPNMEEAQLKVREAARKVRETLGKQENITLGGTVDWSKLTGGQYIFDTKELSVAICEVVLRVVKRYNRYA